MPLSGGGFGCPATAPRSTPPGLGLGASEHALLGAVVELPASGGVVLTGRLSPSAQGWLTDHAVGGVVVFPGCGLRRVGDPRRRRSRLLGGRRADAAVAVGAAGVGIGRGAGGGRRRRRVGPAQRVGVLPRRRRIPAGSATPKGSLSVRVGRAGARICRCGRRRAPSPVDVTDGYERLAARGYGYGPAFRGLTAMWRRGDEVFAEVTLPDAAGGVGGFGVHPALLDAALHAVVVATRRTPRRGAAVLLAGRVVARGGRVGGAGADRAVGPVGGARVELADGLGLPVLSVASMVARPVSEQQLLAGGVGLGAGPALRGGLVAGVGDCSAAEPPVLRGVRIRCAPTTIRSRRAYRAHAPGTGRPAVLADRARLRSAGGGDPGRGGAAGGGRHRSGRRRGLGIGAFGADRASRPHRAGGFRCAAGR